MKGSSDRPAASLVNATVLFPAARRACVLFWNNPPPSSWGLPPFSGQGDREKVRIATTVLTGRTHRHSCQVTGATNPTARPVIRVRSAEKFENRLLGPTISFRPSNLQRTETLTTSCCEPEGRSFKSTWPNQLNPNYFKQL